MFYIYFFVFIFIIANIRINLIYFSVSTTFKFFVKCFYCIFITFFFYKIYFCSFKDIFTGLLSNFVLLRTLKIKYFIFALDLL